MMGAPAWPGPGGTGALQAGVPGFAQGWPQQQHGPPLGGPGWQQQSSHAMGGMPGAGFQQQFPGPALGGPMMRQPAPGMAQFNGGGGGSGGFPF